MRNIYVRFIPLEKNSNILIPYKIVSKDFVASDRFRYETEIVSPMDRKDYTKFHNSWAKRCTKYSAKDILTDEMLEMCIIL